MTKYNDIMNRVELTDEMRERVLKNVKAQVDSKKTDSSSETVIKPVTKKDPNRIMLMRSLIAAAVCLIVAGGIFLAWKVVGNKKNTTVSEMETTQGTGVLANGTDNLTGQTLDNIEGINQALGLKLSDLTTLPFKPDGSTYVVYGNDAVITYTRDIEDTCVLTISKSKDGFEMLAENYSISKELLQGDGTKVDLYGEEDGMGYAIWKCGDYFCSLQFGSAVEDTVFEKIITEVNGML